MKLSTLHHVAVRVDDVELSITGLRGLVTFEVVEQGGGFALLRFENVFLALIDPEHPGGRHIGFVIDDGLFSALRSAYGSKTHRDGSVGIYIKEVDPVVELLQESSISPKISLASPTSVGNAGAAQ